jgi:hypothetical protein
MAVSGCVNDWTSGRVDESTSERMNAHMSEWDHTWKRNVNLIVPIIVYIWENHFRAFVILSHLISSLLVSSRHISSRHISFRHISFRHISFRHISSRHIASRLIPSLLFSSQIELSRIKSNRLGSNRNELNFKYRYVWWELPTWNSRHDHHCNSNCVKSILIGRIQIRTVNFW